jgi:hypothetical protein
MKNVIRGIFSALILICVLSFHSASAQEYVPTEVKDIKENPQRFWAKGIVFRDTLKSFPDNRTLKIDNRVGVRFFTEELGEMYVPSEMVDVVNKLTLGSQYLFSGTVAQRGREYYVIVKEAATVAETLMQVPEIMESINLNNPTSEYNRVIATLETIMKDVRQELFAYATANNITIKELFDRDGEHRSKVIGSVRTNLRKIEERSKMPSQEFLVSLIVSFMAVQQGYVEPSATVYQPEQSVVSDNTDNQEIISENTPTQEMGEEISKGDWDLSSTSAPAESVTVEEVAPVADVVDDAMPAEITTEELVPVEKEIEVIETDGDATITEPVEQSPDAEVVPAVPVAEELNVEEAAVIEEPVAEPEVETDAEVVAVTPDEIVEPELIVEPTGDVVVEEILVGEEPHVESFAEEAVVEPAEDEQPAIEPIVESMQETSETESAPEATIDTVTEEAVLEPVVAEPTVEPVMEFVEELPISEPATEPAVEPVVEEVVVESVVAPEPEKPAADAKKKTEKKKKKSKKEKQVETAPETQTEQVNTGSQDEIDYSKPLRVR